MSSTSHSRGRHEGRAHKQHRLPTRLRVGPKRHASSFPRVARGFPSPLWGGVRGGGNPDIDVLESPPPCPSPTRGEGTPTASVPRDADKAVAKVDTFAPTRVIQAKLGTTPHASRNQDPRLRRHRAGKQLPRARPRLRPHPPRSDARVPDRRRP